MKDYKLAAICDEDMSDLLPSLNVDGILFCKLTEFTSNQRPRIIRAEMIFEIIVFHILAHTVTNARVYYVDDSNVVQQKSDGIGYDNINNFEQSSRDLDLSFSTGDTSNDNNYPRDNYPLFKRVNPVRPYGNTERQYFDINKEMDRLRTYKLIEVPERRTRFEEIIPDPKDNAKLRQITGNRKGEVIFELRVITNNDAM